MGSIAAIAHIRRPSSSVTSVSNLFEPIGNLGGAQPVVGHDLAGVTFTIAAAARISGTTAWSPTIVAHPGNKIQIVIRFENTSSGGFLNDLGVGLVLPSKLSYIEGTTKLRSTAFPSGIVIRSDNIPTGGIDVGNYAASSVGYVVADLQLAGNDAFPCGETAVTVRTALRPKLLDQESEATVLSPWTGSASATGQADRNPSSQTVLNGFPGGGEAGLSAHHREAWPCSRWSRPISTRVEVFPSGKRTIRLFDPCSFSARTRSA